MSDLSCAAPMVCHSVRPFHRLIVVPAIGPLAPGAVSAVMPIEFLDKYRVVWLSAVAGGVAQGVGLNSLEFSLRSAPDNANWFAEGTADGFVPFSAVMGQGGGRVLAFSPEDDSRALVSREYAWSIIVRNADAVDTFTPRIVLAVLNGWGGCEPRRCTP